MHIAQVIEAENLAPISQILTQARNATAESMPFLPTCSPNNAFPKEKKKKNHVTLRQDPLLCTVRLFIQAFKYSKYEKARKLEWLLKEQN